MRTYNIFRSLFWFSVNAYGVNVTNAHTFDTVYFVGARSTFTVYDIFRTKFMCMIGYAYAIVWHYVESQITQIMHKRDKNGSENGNFPFIG